jgi:hypothetical protein
MKRGMLKANAIAVARRCVGNSSGSHVGIQENRPWQKKRIHHRDHQQQCRILDPKEQDRRHHESHGEVDKRGRLAAEPVGEEAEAELANEPPEIENQCGVSRPLRRRQDKGAAESPSLAHRCAADL